MQKIIKITAVYLCWSAVVLAGVDPEEATSTDLAVKAAELEGALPVLRLGNGEKTRDALTNYRQALERFRADKLDGFSRYISELCADAKRREAELNQRAKQNTIRRSEYQAGLAAVAEARLECDSKNYETSGHWQLYDRILQRYRRLDAEVKRRLNDCISQDACRQRKN